MTEPSDLSPLSAAPFLGGQVGPGRNIRMAREAAGLSLEELATQMRLARATLDALERDDFSTLSEPVYIRGYYRKCAKALNLSEAELLAGYERLAAPKAPPPPTKLLLASSEAGAVGGRRGDLRWVAAMLVAVLIGAVLFLTTRSGDVETLQKAAETPVATPETQAAPQPEPLTPSSSAPAGDGLASVPPPPPAAVTSTAATAPEPVAATPAESSAASGATPAVPASQMPVSAEPPRPALTATAPAVSPSPAAAAPAPASTPPPAAVAAVAAPAPTRPAGPSELKLHFRGTSWVRVQDATGKTLLSGVIESGEQQALTGMPPYSVFLGNAPSVDVEYGGQPIKLDSYVKGNSTARFNVPQTP